MPDQPPDISNVRLLDTKRRRRKAGTTSRLPTKPGQRIEFPGKKREDGEGPALDGLHHSAERFLNREALRTKPFWHRRSITAAYDEENGILGIVREFGHRRPGLQHYAVYAVRNGELYWRTYTDVEVKPSQSGEDAPLEIPSDRAANITRFAARALEEVAYSEEFVDDDPENVNRIVGLIRRELETSSTVSPTPPVVA